MKLRTRLIISFCIIIFVPVLLAGATIWGFGEFQMRTVRQAYNIDGGAYEYLTNSIKVLSHFTKADYEALQKVAKEEPEKLEEQAYLEKINQELAGKYSYLIVRKEDNIIYGKDINPEVSEKLPEYANESAESASGIYIEGEAQVLLKQIDFTYSDDSEGTAFIVTSMEKIVPEVKKMVIDMGISVILILIFTGGMLTIWIYRVQHRILRRGIWILRLRQREMMRLESYAVTLRICVCG